MEKLATRDCSHTGGSDRFRISLGLKWPETCSKWHPQGFLSQMSICGSHPGYAVVRWESSPIPVPGFSVLDFPTQGRTLNEWRLVHSSDNNFTPRRFNSDCYTIFSSSFTLRQGFHINTWIIYWDIINLVKVGKSEETSLIIGTLNCQSKQIKYDIILVSNSYIYLSVDISQ